MKQPELVPDKKRIRWAVTMVYFCMGLCFASWASRIPDIKTYLHLSDAMLGTILFALPAGQFLMMPISGKLVTRFGSRQMLLYGLPIYSICLTNIGFVREGWQLAIALFLFGLAGNLCNISINTQGVAAERLYQRPIMASFLLLSCSLSLCPAPSRLWWLDWAYRALYPRCTVRPENTARYLRALHWQLFPV